MTYKAHEQCVKGSAAWNIRKLLSEKAVVTGNEVWCEYRRGTGSKNVAPDTTEERVMRMLLVRYGASSANSSRSVWVTPLAKTPAHQRWTWFDDAAREAILISKDDGAGSQRVYIPACNAFRNYDRGGLSTRPLPDIGTKVFINQTYQIRGYRRPVGNLTAQVLLAWGKYDENTDVYPLSQLDEFKILPKEKTCRCGHTEADHPPPPPTGDGAVWRCVNRCQCPGFMEDDSKPHVPFAPPPPPPPETPLTLDSVRERVLDDLLALVAVGKIGTGDLWQVVESLYRSLSPVAEIVRLPENVQKTTLLFLSRVLKPA